MKSAEIDTTATRYIELQGVRPNTESIYPDNAIISSKYTKFNFLPKSLLSQFSSLPKLWFLLISILEMTVASDISISYGTLLPLTLLIVLGLLRDGFVDYEKHVSDTKLNSQRQYVWDGNSFLPKESKNILVGDIVLLNNNQVAPADMLVLCVGNEEHECYADVSAVIGESNLKVKHPVKEVQNKFESIDVDEASINLTLLNDDLMVIAPNKSFRHFNGKVRLALSPTASNVDSDNLLLCGMRITNTPWIFGIVIYTGVETKIWINNLKKVTKVSFIKKTIDNWTMCMFPVVILICVINTAVFQGLQLVNYKWYDIFLSNLILLNHFIQISVFLSFEMIRVIIRIIDLPNENLRLNSSVMLANLGMVEYIVTDKTGTLTENFLDVALFILNERLYVNAEPSLIESEDDHDNSGSRLSPTARALSNFYSEAFPFKQLQCEFADEPGHPKLLSFFTCLAICNLAFPVEDEFIAISVDDRVLARTAASFGIRVVSRDSEHCTVNVQGIDVVFDVLGTQAFSSDVKKSRIVVRSTVDAQVVMYVKGGREAMISIYDPVSYDIIKYRSLFLGMKRMNPKEAEEFLFDYETAQLSPVNRQGRVENVFQKFERGLEFLGIVGLEDVVLPETRSTVESLKEAGIKFWVCSGDSEESTLTAAVAAGIFKAENKIIRLVNFSSELDCMNILQDSIRENIFPESQLERMSVDSEAAPGLNAVKSEANLPPAISVASVSVEDMMPPVLPRRKVRRSTLFVREASRRSTVHPLVAKFTNFKRNTSLDGEYNPKNLRFILSVDSTGLEYGTSSKEHLKYFTSLLFTAKAVCFHSLLPDQKTKVVKLIKHNFRFSPTVMSVGDGISDVGMLQEADISAGIEGREGAEASTSADVKITAFAQLKELILVLGHRQYVRLSKMILLSFYVMAVLETQLIVYNPLTAWTAGAIVPKPFMVVYRLVVNILPITILPVLDRDGASTMLNKKAYRAGIFNSLLTYRNLISYFGIGVLQGGVTFLFTEMYFRAGLDNGRTENELMIGTSAFFIITVSVFVSALVETFAISVKVLTAYAACVVVMLAAVLPLSYTEPELEGFIEFTVETKSLWVIWVMAVLFNFAVFYAFKAFRYLFFPNIIEKIRIMSPSNSVQIDSRLGQFRKTLKQVYKESTIWKHRSAFDDTALNFNLLRFISHYREKIYQADKLIENLRNFKILLLIGGISVSIYSLYSLLSQVYSAPNPAMISFHIAASLVLLCTFLVPTLPNFHLYSLLYLAVAYILIQAFYLISQVAFALPCVSMCSYLPVLYLIGFSNHWLEMTLLVLGSSVSTTVIAAFQFYEEKTEYALIAINTIEYCIIFLCICLTASLVAYHIDKSKRQEFVLVQKVQVEIARTKSVLNYLLPAFVTKRVQDGVRYISDYQGIVSVIFCDINNFESILKYYSPQELTAFLDEVYGKFDQICMQAGCTKIETVGKTYMACAGLRDSEAEMDPYYATVPHARRCVEMGLAIIRNAEKIYLKNKEVLQFNIGVNSGPVTAGVVGHHKPQFSLVGDTVNTASRMASLCPKPNTLQISEATFALIKDRTGLVFEPSQVNAKGKGLMKTFLVSVPEAQDSGTPTKKNTAAHELTRTIIKNKKTKKTTLYEFSNLHSDHDRRRSSLLDDLEAEVASETEFVRKETEVLEKAKWFSLGCKETSKERNFRMETSEATYPIMVYGMILRLVCNALLIVLTVVRMGREGSRMYPELLTLLIEALVVAVVVTKLRRFYKSIWYAWLICAICLIGSVFRFGQANTNNELVFVQYIYHLLQAAHCSQLLFKNFVLAGLCAVLAQAAYAGAAHYPNFVLHILASLVFFAILLISIYSRENKLRYFATLKVAAEKKLQQTQELLTQMMPKHVAESLKERASVTENISNVTILYADIVGFTLWSASKTPGEVVNMLSELFTEFDKKCKEYEVYKVHTIGDCYVAMGYTGKKSRTDSIECYSLAKFALALVDVIKLKNIENGTELNMRIGMHTGDIIGAIAGTNIVRYDIYGIDVYIANKMESKGTAGSVKVSEATMKMLHNNYPMSFIFNRDEDVYVPITNSRIKTYFMELNPQEEAQAFND
jgi:phospholipid-transporting ATPase